MDAPKSIEREQPDALLVASVRATEILLRVLCMACVVLATAAAIKAPGVALILFGGALAGMSAYLLRTLRESL